MRDIHEKWSDLCEEFEPAKSAYLDVCATVIPVFARVANGGCSNPSMADLDLYEQRSQRIEEIKRKMDDFVKANAM